MPEHLAPASGGSPDPESDPVPARDTRASIRAELVIVFLISLGMSGLLSLVSIIETQIKAARAQISLAQVHVAVAAPQSDVSVIDLIRQLLQVVKYGALGCLGLYLLWRAGVSLSERLGLNLRRRWTDLAAGLGLAALIGIPGLGLYLLANHLGLSLTVIGSSLTDTWWRIPVSILLAVANAFLEEALVVGYLLTRLGHLRVPVVWAVVISAVLRGSYHLYQGYGGFVGNAIMGVIFALVFLRWRRLWPLVIAHSVIDIVVFVGYPLVQNLLPH